MSFSYGQEPRIQYASTSLNDARHNNESISRSLKGHMDPRIINEILSRIEDRCEACADTDRDPQNVDISDRIERFGMQRLSSYWYKPSLL